MISSIEPLESRRLLAADLIFAGINKSHRLTLVGTPGDDHYVLTEPGPGPDYKLFVDRDGVVTEFEAHRANGIKFDGGAGNDSVEISPLVSAGNATLYGGDGNDTLMGGQYFDLIHGGVGADVLMGGNQRDTIYGEGGKDKIYGNAYNDLLFGGAGNDKINGGKGDDNIDGGSGNDTLSTGSGQDIINGADGTDTGLDLTNLTTPPNSVEIL